MKKGIIMQIDDSYLTLLTPDGEFLRAKKQDQKYSIGEEIHFTPGDLKPAKSFFIKAAALKPVWVTAAALMVFLGSYIPVYQSNKAYAYMSIDLNPSIELGVNKKMQVVKLTGYNQEGKKVISQLNDWKKKDVSEITKAILVEIKHEGFLKDNNHIIISTVRTEKVVKDVEKKLEDNINEIKTVATNQEIELTVMSGTEQELKKAHELGITTGKYQAENAPKGQLKKEQNAGKQDNKANGYSSKSTEKIPPGQLKKKMDNNGVTNNEGARKNPHEEKKNPVVENHDNRQGNSKIPPGQLKKNDQANPNPIQNPGQSQKQFNNKDKPNHNGNNQNGNNKNGNNQNGNNQNWNNQNGNNKNGHNQKDNNNNGNNKNKQNNGNRK